MPRVPKIYHRTQSSIIRNLSDDDFVGEGGGGRSDSQGRAGPHLAITSAGVTEESLLEVHCTHCELHSTVKSR